MLSFIRFAAVGLLALHALARPVEEAVVEARATDATTKTAVTDATYQKLVHYAAFPRAASVQETGICAVPPSSTTILQSFNITSSDTQATLFRDDSAQEFVLGIPGTNDLQDALTDITFIEVPYFANGKCTGCAVHLGFYSAWSSLNGSVVTALQTALAQYPSYNIVVSGHSLGGAIAALAFASLKPMYSSKVTGTFTYGQPRTGNQAFADYVDSLAGASDSAPGIFYRTTHYDDGVPQLPLRAMGYQHSRTEYWESTMNVTEALTYRCIGQEQADCNDQFAPGFNAAHSSYAGLQYDCVTGALGA